MTAKPSFTPEFLEELHILSLYNLAMSEQGIKVHQSTAEPEAVAAVRRLHEKGLVTHADGGYLTSLGRNAAEHAQAVITILTSGADQ
jgi:uncharacterized protein (TIGR02647 family)